MERESTDDPFVDLAEKFADKVFADKRKEELDALCKKAKRYEVLLNDLSLQEHEGYTQDGEKKRKVCRCAGCSNTREKQADLLLDEYNNILWEIFPQNKNWVWVETRREDKHWSFHRVDYKKGEDKEISIGH